MTKARKCLISILGLVIAAGLGACGAEPTPNAAADSNYSTAPTEAPIVETPPVVPPAPTRYTLDEAAKRGLIEYEVKGRGGSSGPALELKVRRLKAERIEIYVPPGTVFETGSSGVQSMVAKSIIRQIAEDVAEEVGERVLEEIVDGVVGLDDDDSRTFLIEAYCRDFELENPSPQDGFVSAAVDLRSAAILQAADEQNLGVRATQAAVWMDRGVEPLTIAKQFPATPEDFDAAARLLAGLR